MDFLRLKLDMKEPEIIELLYPELEEILKVTKIGRGEYQRKAFVAVCNKNGITGLGEKSAATDEEAIEGTRRNARLFFNWT